MPFADETRSVRQKCHILSRTTHQNFHCCLWSLADNEPFRVSRSPAFRGQTQQFTQPRQLNLGLQPGTHSTKSLRRSSCKHRALSLSSPGLAMPSHETKFPLQAMMQFYLFYEYTRLPHSDLCTHPLRGCREYVGGPEVDPELNVL